MKIKTKIIAGVLIAASVAALTGCNSNKPDVEVESARREIKRDEKMLYADSYDMDVTLDAEAKTLESAVTAKIYNNTDVTLDEILFHIPVEDYLKEKGSSLSAEVTGAYLGTDKTASLEYVVDSENPGCYIFVSLGDKKLDPGSEMMLTLEVKENIPEEDMRFGHFTSDKYDQFVLGDCFPKVVEFRNDGWMLITNNRDETFAQVSDYQVEVHLPEGYTAVGTGVEIPSDDCISLNAVDSRDFAFVATNNYKSYYLANGKLTANLYYPDETQFSDMVINVFSSRIPLGMDWMEDYVYVYPWNQYDIVLINTDQDVNAYPGLTVIGGKDIIGGVSNDKKEDTENAYGASISKGLLKQWFFEIIGSNKKTDGWLSNGLTAWFSDYMGVKTYGDLQEHRITETIEEMKKKYPEAMSMKLSATFPDEETADIVNTYRGAEFIEELFRRLGEEEFFAAMKDYFMEYKYKEADTKGFLDIIQNHSETDLKQLIDEFV